MLTPEGSGRRQWTGLLSLWQAPQHDAISHLAHSPLYIATQCIAEVMPGESQLPLLCWVCSSAILEKTKARVMPAEDRAGKHVPDSLTEPVHANGQKL